MSESFFIDPALGKREKYQDLVPVIKSLCEGETSEIANMANLCAVLKEVFGWLWVGFYISDGRELVLGPFQGPVACTRIALGKGVCGTAWKEEKVMIVPDVDAFPGHIACSSLSKSEIVLPYFKAGNVAGVLDIDSTQLNSFDSEDEDGLQTLLDLLFA
ncbi:MAG: GAF domain-containing protein [Bacteroidetes bacterium]|nr:GAF domain-containing protein [Bacteroidota bacterium]